MTTTLEHAASNLLPSHPAEADKKRFRNQKSYYKSIRTKASAAILGLEEWHWYDYWHYHADWPGYGNLKWKHRKSHIEALCIVFGNFVRQTQEYDKPYQLWLFLDREDAGQDAVYFHTPNPNHDGFPAKINNVAWGLPVLEEWLAQFLPSLPLRAGAEIVPGKYVLYYIYSPGHGEPLE